VNREQNQITIERSNGDRQSYDPRRLSGVTVYSESERTFSKGDRVQFTAPSKELHVANRQLGTVERIENDGDLRIRTDSGRRVEFNVKEWRHIDHGYAVTSHSSQGQTADRVLIHVDTEQGHAKLINNRLAYVAVSRGRHDAQIYTNDRAPLAQELSRDVSHRTATQPDRAQADIVANNVELTSPSRETVEHVQTQGQGVGR
jgi:ATP-dependent exoDNAse (exonuclease V) alpha subunit